MVAGRAGTVLASAIRWAATLAAGTGVQRGDGGTVAGGEGVSSEGEHGDGCASGLPDAGNSGGLEPILKTGRTSPAR